MLSAHVVRNDYQIDWQWFGTLVKYTISFVYDMMRPDAQKWPQSGVETFWEKPNSDPPLKWEKWQIQAKLAILAKENITLDTSEHVQLPLQPIFENTIQGLSAQSERERLARNAQLNMIWENRCQWQLENEIMWGEKLWKQGKRKTISMFYASLGTERRRIVSSRKPRLKMDTLTATELWQIMEQAFVRPQNLTFDRYMLLTTKQTKVKSIERFYWKLKEFSENCKLGNQEDTSIRDLFIANMQDSETQKKLLKDTVEPAQALRLAINIELGPRNQLQITKSQPNLCVNAIMPQLQFCNSNKRSNF